MMRWPCISRTDYNDAVHHNTKTGARTRARALTPKHDRALCQCIHRKNGVHIMQEKMSMSNNEIKRIMCYYAKHDEFLSAMYHSVKFLVLSSANFDIVF